MTHPLFALPRMLRAASIGLSIVAGGVMAMPEQASAQLVAAIVNGQPITKFDVEQRSKLLQLSTRKTPSRKEVIEELIDEKLKIQLAQRFSIPDLDKDVDAAFANMARRMNSSPKAFTEQLARSGLRPDTLKSRMKAELIWSQIIRGRYQSSFQFSDKDVQERLATAQPANADVVGHDYTLRPILFMVTRGSPAARFEARKKEAEALRAQFQSCQQGLPLARSLRYVTVQRQIVKGSAELPQALRAILEKTEIGRLTAPETVRDGVQVYAVCSRRQSDNAPAKKEMRDKMFQEKFDSIAKNYLKELRGQAMIEYR